MDATRAHAARGGYVLGICNGFQIACEAGLLPGILVRNVIPDAGKAPEGVILFVSPAGGIQLEWNSNADTSIDSVTPANGTIDPTVPVHLKLVRSGSTYTGYYSMDGSTWQTVGSATVPGQATTQDAGIFVTSHSTGSPAEADFSGFSVG